MTRSIDLSIATSANASASPSRIDTESALRLPGEASVILSSSSLRLSFTGSAGSGCATAAEAVLNGLIDSGVDIIKQTNYVNYFLVVADFIDWAK